MNRETQAVPVRVYRGEEHIVLVAPMPGMDPNGISISVSGNRVIIRGEEPGPRQDLRDLIVEEWKIGPYYREVSLPETVDGARTNATFGNGVLTLAMPKVEPSRATGADFALEAISPTRGERVGHAGSAIHPTTTREHRQKQH